MLMEISMKANGSMIRPRDKAPILMQTEHTMKESGSTTSNMDMESNHGLMVPDMKVIMKMVKKRAKVD